MKAFAALAACVAAVAATPLRSVANGDTPLNYTLTSVYRWTPTSSNSKHSQAMIFTFNDPLTNVTDKCQMDSDTPTSTRPGHSGRLVCSDKLEYQWRQSDSKLFLIEIFQSGSETLDYTGETTLDNFTMCEITAPANFTFGDGLLCEDPRTVNNGALGGKFISPSIDHM